MGKRNRKRVKKMKCINKAARNERKIETASTRNADVNTDGKNLSFDSQGSGEIQEPGNIPQFVTEGIDVNESRNLSTSDDEAKQSSQLKESDMIDGEIKDMLYAIDKTMVVNKWIRGLDLKYLKRRFFPARSSFVSSSLEERYKDLSKLLEPQNPPLDESTEQHAILKGKEYIPNPLKTVESSKEILETEQFLMSKVIGDGDEETDLKFANVADDVDGMITDLRNGLERNVRPDDVDISVEDIQKSASSAHLLMNRMNDKKCGEEYTGNTQKPENSLHNLNSESDDEMLDLIEDVTAETVPEVKDSLKISDMNETVNVPGLEEKRFANFYRTLRNQVDDLLAECYEYGKLENARANKLIDTLSEKRYTQGKASIAADNSIIMDLKAAKERGDKINAIVEGLRIFQCHFNETEGRKEGKNGNDCNGSNGNIQDFHSEKEMMTDMRPAEGCESKNEDKTIDPKKSDGKTDFKRDLKEFMELQNFKMDNRVKEYKDMVPNTGPTIEQQGHFSEKGPLVDETKTKSHDKTDNTTDCEDKNIEENGSPAKQNEPKVIGIELDKNDEIHFQIEINGKQHVAAHGYFFYFKNTTHTFNFKNESIQVSFNGYQILISTQKTEFNISIRNDFRYLKEKSNPFNLADEATQTECLQ